MTTVELAAAAVALLRPYLGKAGEAFAKKAGEQLADKSGGLYQLIRAKFRGDAYAEQTLTRAEEQPESSGRQSALEQLLLEKLQDDAELAHQVRELVDEADRLDSRRVTAVGDRSIAVGGDVSQSSLITGDSNVVGDHNSLSPGQSPKGGNGPETD